MDSSKDILNADGDEPLTTDVAADLAYVEDLSRRIDNPVCYFMGMDAASADRPKNILLFTRSSLGESAHIDSQHHRFVLIICLKKAGDVCLNGRIIGLDEGHILLVFPHQLHHYLNVSREMFWLFITFELDAPEYLVTLRDTPVPLSAASSGTLRKLVSKYRPNSPQAVPPTDCRKVPLFLALLLEEFLDDAPPQTNGLSAVLRSPAAVPNVLFIDKVNKFIYENLRSDLSNRSIGMHLGVSTSHLRFIVRKTLGIGLGHYVKQIKINHAIALLSENRLTISQIAVECGFASVFSLSRAFKRMTGAPPSKYLK